MFTIMQRASRGDDVYEEDPDVRILEHHVAKLAGHESALFCVSGTMTNQLAFRSSLLQPPWSVLCDTRSHVYRYEAGGIAALSQATVYAAQAFTNNGHHLTVQDVARDFVVDDHDVHMAPTRLISLENTLDGVVMPLQEFRAIAKFARTNNARLHLDGARLWNAAVAQGCNLRDYTRECDSVSLCLSKGLGAPIGSMLVGSKVQIQKARHFRKMIGGGWRQAGGLAAVALWCIENIWPTMKETHELASYLARELRDAGATIHIPVETNMVFLDLAGTGIRLSELSTRLETEMGIKIGSKNAPVDQTQVRLVLHYQISREAVDKLLTVFRDMASNASSSNPRNLSPSTRNTVYSSR
ncbi:Threonine aldolase [Gryganskiella cystojenkinii]|nr:Threonine aldolase [Gryganskiella cystojenkinii]